MPCGVEASRKLDVVGGGSQLPHHLDGVGGGPLGLDDLADPLRADLLAGTGAPPQPDAHGSRVGIVEQRDVGDTREVGGELYFLREVGSLAEIYHTIALKLEAEYTLGYYSAAGVATSGWRKLKYDYRRPLGPLC